MERDIEKLIKEYSRIYEQEATEETTQEEESYFYASDILQLKEISERESNSEGAFIYALISNSLAAGFMIGRQSTLKEVKG